MSLSQRVLALLSRTTSGRPIIPEIDGLRFLALCPVILYHLWGNFSTYAKDKFLIPHEVLEIAKVLCIDDGKMGVKLFFIISGFILCLPFARYHLDQSKKISLSKYFKRRIVRLEPPYILNVLLLFLVIMLVTHQQQPMETFKHFLASMFYVHNAVFGQQSLINAVAWSLEIEVQFYIMAPLLSILFAVSSASIRRCILIVGILAGTVISEFVLGPGRLQLSILNYSQYFLVGFLLVELYLVQRDESFKRHFGYDLLMLGSLGGFFALGFIFRRFELCAPWFGLLIVISAFRGIVSNQVFTNPWIYTIGGMCYTIYLYHFVIIGASGHGRLFLFDSFWPNFALTFTVIPVVVMIFSSVLFVMFEKPFMRDWHTSFSRFIK